MATFGLASTWADEKITIRKDSDGDVTIRHEGIDDDINEDYLRITVKTAPPEPKQEVEVVQTKPGDDYVWVPGYRRWNSTSGEYEWGAGVWHKQIPNYTWVSGKWVKVGDEYFWQPGYWTPKAGLN